MDVEAGVPCGSWPARSEDRLRWVFFWWGTVVAVGTAVVVVGFGAAAATERVTSLAGIALVVAANHSLLRTGRRRVAWTLLALLGLIASTRGLSEVQLALPLFFTTLDLRAQYGTVRELVATVMAHLLALGSAAVIDGGSLASALQPPVLFQLIGFPTSAGLLWYASHALQVVRSTQQSLHSVRRQLDRFIEAVPLGVAIIDLEAGRIDQANPALRRMLDGCANVRGITELIHPDDAARERVQRASLHERRSDMFTAEVRMRRNSSWMWMRLTEFAAPASGDERSIAFGLFEDVTERRAMEQALLDARTDAEAAYRNIFASIPDDIMVIDEDWRFIEVNAVALDRHGSERVAVDRSMCDIVDVERTPITHLREAAERAAVEGHATVDCWLLLADEGGSAPFEMTLSRAFVRSRPALIVVARDIGERHRLQHQLLQVQKLEAIGKLAGGIAHDFNNTLMAVGGHAEYTLRSLEDADPLREEMNGILAAVERASRVTRQLLLCGRNHSHQPRRFALDELLGGLQPLLRRALPETITLRVDARPAWIHADPAQLEQVILNLVLNSRDALPHGGTIAVSATGEDLVAPLSTPAGTLRPGGYVRIEVADDGTGMTNEVKLHAFEPFFTTKGPGQGSGLGLSSVLGTVRNHGGGVRIESTPGIGTRVVLWLQRAEAAAQAAEISAPPPPGTVRGTILLVEDATDVRFMIGRALRTAGYSVIEAANAEEALRLANHGLSFDLLLTDVVMPGMDGMEMYERLKGQRTGLRVLFISGYAQTTSTTGPAARGLPLLQKPFSWGDLALRVDDLMQPEALAS